MPSLIAGKVRQAIAARLEDPAYGYNACVQPFAEELGAVVPQINFTGTAQFFQAYCDPELIEDGTPFTFPLILLYSLSSDNTKPIEKFREFAGVVLMAVEVVHSWSMDSIDPAAFENTADCVEAAMYQVINAQTAGTWLPPCVLYDGYMKQTRHPVTMGGLGLLLRQSFVMTFRQFI